MFGVDPRGFDPTIATGEPTPRASPRRTRVSTASARASATATDATPPSPSAPRLRLARTSRSRPCERAWMDGSTTSESTRDSGRRFRENASLLRDAGWTRSRPASGGTVPPRRRRRDGRGGWRRGDREDEGFRTRRTRRRMRSPPASSQRRRIVRSFESRVGRPRAAGAAPSPGCRAPRRPAGRLRTSGKRREGAIVSEPMVVRTKEEEGRG